MTDHDDEVFEQFEVTTDKKSLFTEAQLRQRIMHRAIAYLSRREYSQHELKQKLTHAFAEASFSHSESEDAPKLDDLIEATLEYLAKNNWQSDTRFADIISKVKASVTAVRASSKL